MHLDIRTEAVLLALASFAVTLLYILLWRARRTYPGFGRWTVALMSLSVSLTALALRGQMPLVASIVLTNTAGLLSYVLVLEGTREFLGMPYRSIAAYGFAASSLFLLLFFFFVTPNDGARIVIASISSLIFLGLTGTILLRGVGIGRKLGYRFTGALFLTGAFGHVVRIVAITVQHPGANVLSPTLWNQFFFVATLLAVIGAPFGFITINHDRLVADLEAAEHRAAAADRAKSDFLAHMSHEIRTPLNGVIGLTGLVLAGPLSEDKRSELETAARSAETLREIVDDILDLSKIEAGRLPIARAPFDLHSVLVRAKALVEPRAASKSVLCRLLYAASMPRWFDGDEMRVRQIVSNFAANAAKFTEDGEIEFGAGQAPAGVRIWVRDTGPGIPPEKLSALFSRFSQVDESIASRYGGTGLGLAIAKELAGLMQGSVGVSSEVGRGSTFWVELPLLPVDPPAADAELPGLAPESFAGIRALVAEDNPTNRIVLVRWLERYGLTVDVVTNGDEAVRSCRDGDYGIVLMDCRMPVLDGYEATRRIRIDDRRRGRHTPIVAITANAMSSDRELCHEAGMDDYLTKPIQPAELARCVARYAAKVGG